MLQTLTVFTVMILVSLTLALTLMYMGYKRHAELRQWSLGMLLNAITYILFAFRGHFPDWWGILLPNVIITSSFAVFAEGVYRFQHRPPRRWLLWLPLPLAALIAGLNTYNDVERLVMMGVLNTAQVFYIFVAMTQRRQSTAGRGQDLITAGLVGVLLVYAIRIGMALWAPENTLVAGFNHLAQGISFTVAILSLLLIAQGMVVMLEERTEQTLKNSAARLQERERHYRTLIEAANEGICVLHKGCVRYANPRLYELTGYRAFDILGKPFLEFIASDDQEAARQFHEQRLLGHAERQHIEVRVRAASGELRWFDVTGVRYEWQGEPATLNFLSDITERKQREARVLDFAYRDALTALPNRRALFEHLPAVIERTRQNRTHAALIFIDLDNFKPLNDQAGHAMGDVLLSEVTRRLNTCVATHDLVARFGGDEFVVLLCELDPQFEQATQQARTCAERIRQRLALPYILSLQEDGVEQHVRHHCTASLGLVVFDGQVPTVSLLLGTADKAMYEAKQQGRDRIVIAPPPAVGTKKPPQEGGFDSMKEMSA